MICSGNSKLIGGDALILIFSTIVQIFMYIIRIYTFVLLASSILRMVKADETNQIVSFVHLISDPPARWLTRKFPKLLLRSGYQVIDLGPIVLIVALGALLIALGNLLQYLAVAI